jgi:hypothetical protein
MKDIIYANCQRIGLSLGDKTMFKSFDKPITWEWNYNRPVGREACFHVTIDDRIKICQNHIDESCEFEAVMTPELRKLAKAINASKQKYSGHKRKGGSFCINEFGTVIVPFAPKGRVFTKPLAIGQWSGDIFFEDDYGDEFSLDLDLDVGDYWELPYLGMKYHLSKRGELYYIKHDEGEYEIINCPQKDRSLIARLESVRGDSGLTFLVNYCGHVLVKEEDSWQPIYAGKINIDKWFKNPIDIEIDYLAIEEQIRMFEKKYGVKFFKKH